MEARKARAARGLSDAAAGGGDADGGSGQRSDGGEEGEEAGTDTDAVEGQQQEQEQAEDETDEKTKQCGCTVMPCDNAATVSGRGMWRRIGACHLVAHGATAGPPVSLLSPFYVTIQRSAC